MVLLFSEESLSKKKKKKKKRSFVFKQPTPLRQNDYGPTQPTQPARRRTRAREREREKERDDEFCRFGAAALPERKKESVFVERPNNNNQPLRRLFVFETSEISLGIPFKKS